MSTMEQTGDGINQYREGRLPQLTTRLAQRQTPFDPTIAGLTRRAMRAFAPQHPKTQRPLSTIVGRVHRMLTQKHPQRRHLSHQPCVMLHELAHAYHDQVLDFEDRQIKDRFAAAKDAGLYGSVLHIDGRERKHYALTDHKEFFADMTDAYVRTNDFYPFVRSELLRHDPETYRLLEGIWGPIGKRKE